MHAGEVLTPRVYSGAALMVAEIFLMEIDVKKLFTPRGGDDKIGRVPMQYRKEKTNV